MTTEELKTQLRAMDRETLEATFMFCFGALNSLYDERDALTRECDSLVSELGNVELFHCKIDTMQ